VNESEVPTEVSESLPTAKALKRSLDENGYQANVSITPRGEIVVAYSSDASNGPELKEDMSRIAMLYADVARGDTGGLTVAANGIKLMVSSDAAIAYDDGKLKEDAFKKTFHWGSVSQSETEGN
jgi:hypothetical protein